MIYFLLTIMIIFLSWEWMIFRDILVLSHKDDVHSSLKCNVPQEPGSCMDTQIR